MEITKWDRSPAYFNVALTDLSFLSQAHAWPMSYMLAKGVTEPDPDDAFLVQHAAKEQQGLLEARIRDIEFKLSHAHVIDEYVADLRDAVAGVLAGAESADGFEARYS